MASIKVFLDGHFVSTHELVQGHDLLVGRGETCDITLQAEKGISRQHFRIYANQGKWNVEVLSRFGELYVNHQKQTQFKLHHGITFVVPPYEFVYENENESMIAGFNDSAAWNSQVEHSDENTGSNTLDRTHIGHIPAMAYLKLVDEHNQTLQNFRLEGFAWVAGRDTSCSIYIDNPRLSRKQFEIQKQNESYYIRNLGNVNPTLLNGRALDDEWSILNSSDVISVADCKINFELHDALFENKLQEVDPRLLLNNSQFNEPTREEAFFSQNNYQQAAFNSSSGQFASPKAIKPGMTLFGRHIPGLNPVRLGLVIVIVLAGLYGVVNSSSDDKPIAKRAQTPFDKLSPDKQQVVKQIYLTAQSLIAQSRYELARQEIVKLHQIIPFYEDSKEIEETANKGLAILADREKNEAEERQRAEMEQKVLKQVEVCKSQLNANSDLVWLESCLDSIMALNPDHPQIIALRDEVSRLSTERAMKAVQAKEYAERVAALKSLYQKAFKIEEQGLPLPAIDAYRKVTASKLPDPSGLKPKATRQIASLQNDLERKQSESEKLADEAYRNGKFKIAIEYLRKGIAVNPENEVLKGKHLQYLKELHKMMMGFYHEGILEESVGDVDSANKKWKKIIEQSLPGEDYYEKAKLKLKKYGAFE